MADAAARKTQDLVIATGAQHSVREFIDVAADALKMHMSWKGKGLQEKGYCAGKCIVSVDPRYFRPSEVDTLLGNASKARKVLNGARKSPSMRW